MGRATWNSTAYGAYSASVRGLSQSQIFTQSTISPDLSPLNVIRESRDSEQNPESTPVIVAVDDTGSMGYLAEEIIKRGLGVIMGEIYDRKPIKDPHLMCMSVGDAFSDNAPLQVTQFEASTILAKQVEKFFIEGNGGGNGGESYPLVWYFAAFKTQCDSQLKRNKKGYIFTVGDEAPHGKLTKEQIRSIFGDENEADFNAADLLDAVLRDWEVFHLIVKPHARQPVREKWNELLGERAILVADHAKLAEVIVSTIQVCEGEKVDDVAKSWSGDTSLVVREALKGLTPTAKSDGAGGIVAL